MKNMIDSISFCKSAFCRLFLYGMGDKILNFPTKGNLGSGRNPLHLQGQFLKEE